MDKDTFHYKQGIYQKYGQIVYGELWFTTLREALDAFIDITQENVTGNVKLKLYKYNISKKEGKEKIVKGLNKFLQ